MKGPRPVAEKDEDLARLMDLARGLLSKSEFQLKMGEFCRRAREGERRNSSKKWMAFLE
mgnify:CR=1 FL=1